MFSSTPTKKQVSLPRVQIGEEKKIFRLTKKRSKEEELDIYFQKNDFFPPCKFITHDVSTQKKRVQFLALMEMLQGNCIEFVGDLKLFLSHYFDLSYKDLTNIAEIIKHRSPGLDSLPLIKQFYTDSVINFLTALGYKRHELVVDWNNIPKIQDLLLEIIMDLIRLKVFVKENKNYFPLGGFNLSHIRFPADSNLSYRMCRHTNFTEAILTGANFQGADAQFAMFTGAALSGADFTGAILLGAQFEQANLQGADFSLAQMNDVHLQGADLQGANLQGADLTGAHLEGANLAGANLTGTVLRRVTIQITDFTNLTFAFRHLDDMHIHDNLPLNLRPQDLTHCLSHNGVDLFTGINAISWKYEAKKISLMETLIHRFSNTSGDTRTQLLAHRRSLLNILLSSPVYTQSSVIISKFVRNVLLEVPPALKRANTEVHNFTQVELEDLFGNFIEPYILEGYYPNFFNDYSSAINQILYACRGQNKDLQRQGHLLAQMYANYLPTWVKNICSHDGLDLSIDFSVKNEDYMMVFLASPQPDESQNQQQTGPKETVVCSAFYYETHALNKAKGISWTGFQIISQHPVNNGSTYTRQADVSGLFSIAPLFTEPFSRKNGLGLLANLFKALKLPGASLKLFVDTFSKSTLAGVNVPDRTYFQGIEGEARARAILNPWLRSESINRQERDRWTTVRVSKLFLEAVKNVYKCSTDIPRQQITLLLIGAVFIRLSSEVFYGTSADSVFFFRLMAAGCLNTAETLKNNLPGVWTLETWKTQLGRTARCAENLSREMIQVGRNHTPQIASLIIPAIW